MKKLFCILITILISLAGYSQSNKVESKENGKEEGVNPMMKSNVNEKKEVVILPTDSVIRTPTSIKIIHKGSKNNSAKKESDDLNSKKQENIVSPAMKSANKEEDK